MRRVPGRPSAWDPYLNYLLAHDAPCPVLTPPCKVSCTPPTPDSNAELGYGNHKLDLVRIGLFTVPKNLLLRWFHLILAGAKNVITSLASLLSLPHHPICPQVPFHLQVLPQACPPPSTTWTAFYHLFSNRNQTDSRKPRSDHVTPPLVYRLQLVENPTPYP